MARFTRVQVINAMYELGLVPVFYNEDVETAKKVVKACADGGARVVEFTNRGEMAYQVFSELVKHFQKERPDVILGVGSVVDAGTAAIYINNGANFVVGPILNSEIALLCNRRKISYSPGCGSVSEISRAEELGVEIVKIFPGGQVGGPAFVKAALAPMPWTRIMPTGGVNTTRESIGDWIEAGAACLGIGSKLITKDLVKAKDWSSLTGKVAECLWFIKEARGESLFSGVEHVGLYPANANELADWYKKTFGFNLMEGDAYFFAYSSGPGRIEILKQVQDEKAHIAVRVNNFEAACEAMKGRGIELEEPRDLGRTKLVYLKQPDPAGYRIHLYYQV